MGTKIIPNLFLQLQAIFGADVSNLASTQDGFWILQESMFHLLARKNILDFPDSAGERLLCSCFFDDWFLYAVAHETDYVYSLVKLREQEHDTEDGSPADGDIPGVTVSFIAFDTQVLLDCLMEPVDKNRARLNREINRVVAHRGQRHHPALKKYFQSPYSQGAYLVANIYTRRIASLAKNGCLPVPEHYKEIVQQSISYKSMGKLARLPHFIEALNREAGYAVCDNENIFLKNPEEPTEYEAAAILATHTGNTSVFSFAAEVEYHARFLTPLAKIKIPFFGRSIYDSAIRADMTVGDTEFEGPAPFYKADSKIVKRQYELHHDKIKFP